MDGDRIGRELFAATERLGRPDHNLARELTDGVLHFLAADDTSDPTPVGDLIDATVKVVRELGHPLLARAFVDGTHSADQPNAKSSHPFLPPSLAKGFEDGLAVWLGPEPPTRLLAATVAPPIHHDESHAWQKAIGEAATSVGKIVAIDSPDVALPCDSLAPDWIKRVSAVLQKRGLAAVINLNVMETPSCLHRSAVPDRQRREKTARRLLEESLGVGPDRVRVDWHVTKSDFGSGARDWLRHLATRVIAGDSLTFVVDRGSRPISLAEGIDRENPELLAAVGVDLPRLQHVLGSNVAHLADKAGGLVRLAIAAGRAYRKFLRREAGIQTVDGFRLDRSRLVVVPVGLDQVVRQPGESAVGSIWDSEYAQRILLSLNASLAREAQRLANVIGPMPFPPANSAAPIASGRSPTIQLRQAARLHSAVGGGTAMITLPPETAGQPDAIVSLLEFASRQQGVCRIQFLAAERRYRQLTAGW